MKIHPRSTVELTDGGKKLKVNSDGSVNVNTYAVFKTVVAAGMVDDVDITDKVITTAGFSKVSIINDGPEQLSISIDGNSVSGTKKIFIDSYEAFDEYLTGNDLHYSAVGDRDCTFRYVLS